MRLFDGFLFYNELDMLEYRLTVLDPYVDEFILVESTVTFAGNPKPLYYQENKDRYAKWSRKIHHIVVDDIPPTLSAQDRERWQRNKIADGLWGTTGRDTDALIVSDVDEIPNPRALEMIRNQETCEPVSLEMDVYCSTPELRDGTWQRPKIVSGNHLRERFNNKPDMLRMSNQKSMGHGGWHLRSFGSPESIQNNLRNISRTPLEDNEFPPPRLDLLLTFFPIT